MFLKILFHHATVSTMSLFITVKCTRLIHPDGNLLLDCSWNGTVFAPVSMQVVVFLVKPTMALKEIVLRL